MGVFLSQLPPAELARLKAELAETLIAYFCYPRFFDYRTESLRTRPVDRTKRQEVWLYLSSVDFTAWNRIDLMSPDFQYQIERLLIHFVQRNRNFFGEQGRKRMADIRMLISTSAQAVVQGLRGHLSGNAQSNPPFGSPRPVSSWSTTNVTGRPTRTWEQMSASTLLLQQQLQEARGEIKPASPQPVLPQPQAVVSQSQSEARPTTPPAPTRRSIRKPSPGNGSNATHDIEQQVTAATPVAPVTPVVPVSVDKATPQVNGHSSTPPAPNHKSTAPSNPTQSTTSTVSPTPVPPGVEPVVPLIPVPPKIEPPVPPTPVPPTPVLPKIEPSVQAVEPPMVAAAPAASVAVPLKPTGVVVPPLTTPEKVQPPAPAVPLPSTAVQPRGLPQPAPAPAVAASSREGTAVLSSEGDMAIFEQLRHQLIVWLRIEAIRSGMEIANQAPSQLLELLHQRDDFDETHLQIVSTLLNLSNQVIKNGQASLFDYKQALMLHLMHTKR